MNGQRGWGVFRAAVLAIALAAVGFPRETVASGSGGGNGLYAATVVGGVILIGVPVVTNEILALTSGFKNAASARRGMRPSNGWLGVGYVTNSLNIIGGGVIMFTGLLSKGYSSTTGASGYPEYSVHYNVDWGRVGIGAALLAIGAMGLGFTIWGHSKPTEPGFNLTVKPIAGFGARGEFFAGASLELAGF